MRRALLAVLTVTTGVARAESPWSEYGAAQPLRPAEQLVEAACDMTVDLRGALADVSVTHRLSNPGPTPLGATSELQVPEGAQLYSVVLRRDGKGADPAAIAVSQPVPVDRVASASVLGADPVFVTALPARDGRDRYRIVVQPIEPEHEVTLMMRWTAAAAIRDGAIKLVLPGRSAPCRVNVNASVGAGVTVERLRADAMEFGRKGTGAFELGAQDATLAAVLAFKKNEPLVWTQTSKLADGFSAQAITIITPPVRSLTPRRALLLVDGSRSMELVGRHNVQKLASAVAAALPKDSEIEAVLFDRKPARVFGSFKPVNASAINAIDTAIRTHTSTNGSDTVAALALARTLAGESRTPTMVVLVTDGVIGELPLSALADALGTDGKNLDLHAIALAPGRMTAPDVDMLRAAVDRVGGSYVQVPARDVDSALTDLDQWLRPAWLELALDGSDLAIPTQLRAGTGAVVTGIVRKTSKVKLRGRAELKLAASELAAGPLAPLALAFATEEQIAAEPLAKLRAQHPVVDATRAFVVLASEGKVAANRRAMVAGGGPFTRMVAVDDPKFPIEAHVPNAMATGGSAIDRTTLQLLFRTHLQPAAFACYQRALATKPALAGTAHFKLEIGRGELTRAEVGGLGDSTFDTCLLDAAYAVTPPLPNPDYNVDDRTLVNYSLTFSLKDQKPFVIAGDADSSTPIDIDAIEGGVPASARRKIKLRPNETSTPLGGLRPSPTK